MNPILVCMVVISCIAFVFLWCDIIIELCNPELSFHIWDQLYHFCIGRKQYKEDNKISEEIYQDL